MTLIGYLRKVCMLRRPRITIDDVYRIIQLETRKDVEFLAKHVDIEEHLKTYVVYHAPFGIGHYLKIVIDAESGQVLARWDTGVKRKE